MKNKKDPLDKIFVNCNKLEEYKARRILSSREELSIKSWDWDVPMDLQKIKSSLLTIHQ